MQIKSYMNDGGVAVTVRLVLLSCHRLNSRTSPAVPLSGGRKFFDTLRAEAKNEVNGIAGQTKDEWTGFR